MYKNKKILAFIPARGGSKRVKNKNMVMINDKPLFQYSVDVAKQSKYIDDIIVSTDSEIILNKSIELGCLRHGLRTDYLSNDHARIIDVMLYEIAENNLNTYSAIVLLQPTSPYRTIEMLDSAIEKYFEKETSLITVYKTEENPLFIRTIDDGILKKIMSNSSDIRSQDFPDFYKIIGSIYINNIEKLTRETVLNENEIPFIIDKIYTIDIDVYEDLEKAKEVL